MSGLLHYIRLPNTKKGTPGNMRKCLVNPGSCFNIKMSSYQYRDHMVKIMRSHGRRIFITRIPIPGKTVFLLDILVTTKQTHCFTYCQVIQIKYGLPYCVTCPSMSTDPGSLNSAAPRTRVVGSRNPYEYWGRWHSFGKTYLICIIAQVLKNCFIPLTGILCQREAVWVAAESGDLWSWALHTTHYYYNYQYFCIQWH